MTQKGNYFDFIECKETLGVDIEPKMHMVCNRRRGFYWQSRIYTCTAMHFALLKLPLVHSVCTQSQLKSPSCFLDSKGTKSL